MRVVQHPQMNIGEVDVSKIIFDARSRDDIPKILRGLQHLYTDTTLRQLLGHGEFDKEPYAFQTLNKLKGSVSFVSQLQTHRIELDAGATGHAGSIRRNN